LFLCQIIFLASHATLSIILIRFTAQQITVTASKISVKPTQIYAIVSTLLWCLSIVLWPVILVCKARQIRILFQTSFALQNINDNFNLNRRRIPIFFLIKRDKLFVIIMGSVFTLLWFVDILSRVFLEDQPIAEETLYGIQIVLPQNNPVFRWIILVSARLISYYILLISWIIYIPSMCGFIMLNGISEEFSSHVKRLASLGAVDEVCLISDMITMLIFIKGK